MTDKERLENLNEEKTAILAAQLLEKEVIAEMDRQREVSELEDDPYEEDI